MHEAYLKSIDEFEKRLLNIDDEDEWDEERERLYEYQKDYMEKYLKSYRETATSEAQKSICELIEYAIYESSSGNAIVFVDTKEKADAINEIIWDEIGEMLLDSPEIYEEDGEWVIDCMFGGAFVPDWDGFDEDMNCMEEW